MIIIIIAMLIWSRVALIKWRRRRLAPNRAARVSARAPDMNWSGGAAEPPPPNDTGATFNQSQNGRMEMIGAIKAAGALGTIQVKAAGRVRRVHSAAAAANSCRSHFLVAFDLRAGPGRSRINWGAPVSFGRARRIIGGCQNMSSGRRARSGRPAVFHRCLGRCRRLVAAEMDADSEMTKRTFLLLSSFAFHFRELAGAVAADWLTLRDAHADTLYDDVRRSHPAGHSRSAPRLVRTNWLAARSSVCTRVRVLSTGDRLPSPVESRPHACTAVQAKG
jgi:hypothetical protein